MPSREARRRLERKAEQKSTQEKRLERHPAIFAISFVILVVVIISFIFYGSMGRAGNGSSNPYTFGKYGSKEIKVLRGRSSLPLNYFTSKLDSYQTELANAQQEQARAYWRRAFNDTGFHYSVLDLARASELTVSKNLIVDAIQGSQLFRDKNGNFSEDEYKNTSLLERTQANTLLEEQMIHQQFIDDVMFLQYTSTKEVEFYKSMASKERRFNYVSFKYDDFPEEKVIEYGKANREKFTKIKLSRILLIGKSQREAEDIQNMYNKKEKSFEDLAKTYSKDIYAAQGGDMGSQYFYQVNVFIESIDSVREIFALKKDYLALIKNGDNWEIYRCNEQVIEPDMADATTRSEILQYMKKSERGVIEEYSINFAKSFKDKTATKPFADVCKEIKQYPPYETEFFPINYQDLFPNKGIKAKGSAPSLVSASANKQFFQEAFTLSKDTVSNPIPLDDQVVVLKLIEEKTLTEDDWKTIDTSFSTSIKLAEYGDPVGQAYTNKLYSIAKPNDASTNNMLLQYLYSALIARADAEGIPYQYAFDSLFFRYKDFETVVNAATLKNLTDSFDDTFTKMSKGEIQ